MKRAFAMAGVWCCIAVLLTVWPRPVSAMNSLPLSHLEITLPSAADQAGRQTYFGQDVVLYALGYFVGHPSDLVLGTTSVVIAKDKIWPSALPYFIELAALSSGDAVLDYVLRVLLRTPLYNAAWPTRAHVVGIADTRQELGERLGLLSSGDGAHIRDWDLTSDLCQRRLRNPSQVKKRTRYLWRCRLSDHQKLSLAFTLDSDMFNPKDMRQNPRVLEVEVIIPLVAGDQSPVFDFYAYDVWGKIATHSQFASATQMVVAPSPHACLSCHYDAKRRSFGLSPSGWRSGFGLN